MAKKHRKSGHAPVGQRHLSNGEWKRQLAARHNQSYEMQKLFEQRSDLSQRMAYVNGEKPNPHLVDKTTSLDPVKVDEELIPVGSTVLE